MTEELTDEQFHRYARHLILDEVGEEGQRTLLNASVLVVGAGGLGAPLLMYLAAAGVGTHGVMGSDHSMFRGLGAWNPKSGTPIRALVLQGLLSLAFVFFAGSFIDTILYTAPIVWFFFLATGISVFILRKRDSGTPRPYKVAGFPFTVIIFCVSCIFMLYNSLTYALAFKPIGLIIIFSVVLAGIVIYALAKGINARKAFK